MITTNIQYEVTDTYCGEANYSWVKRGTIACKPGEEYTNLAAIRRVKKELGWNGKRCEVEDYGDAITLRRKDAALVCFISFHSFGRCAIKGIDYA